MTFECIMCLEEFFDKKKVTEMQGRCICKECLLGHPSKIINEKIDFLKEREENET